VCTFVQQYSEAMTLAKKMKIMESTNLVTAANVNYMKCHINGMIGLPSAFARIESVEQVMNIFDYETEEVETIVFAWIKENREVVFA
jgi:hypothetical protein